MSNIVFPYKFQPRWYQLKLMRAMDRGLKQGLTVWHRRCGKDLTFLNITCKEAAKRVGNYNYYLPTKEEARKIIWEGKTKDGRPFLDVFPPDFIKKKNERDMRLEFVNGSAFELHGTDQLNVVGAGPVGCVFSEYSLQNPKARQLILPILRENGGWELLNGTPRGHNHMKKFLDNHKDDPKCYTEVLTINDTKAYSIEEIQRDIDMGDMTWELAQQEYWCSFDYGQEGSVYSLYLSRIQDNGQIGYLPINPAKPVYTFWDLGIDNAMAIWFAQFYNGAIAIIDHIEDTNKGLDFYADKLRERNYYYGGHYAPWDVTKRESNGLTIQRNAEKFGLFFERVKRTSKVTDDIELIRRLFRKMYFDKVKCDYGLDCLRQYHWTKDEKRSLEGRPVFLNKPVHDWTSNTADALRTLARAYELRMIKQQPNAQISTNKTNVDMGRQSNYLKKEQPQKQSLRGSFGRKKTKKKGTNYLNGQKRSL